MTEAKQHKKGSILWNLIVSYIVFSFFCHFDRGRRADGCHGACG